MFVTRSIYEIGSRNRERLGLSLIDKFLLASWIYSFAMLLWLFRVLKQIETKGQEAVAKR